MDTATIIESESRELIRRRGLDVHADQLEPLIREVVADYERRSTSGEVPVMRDDDDTLVAEIAARHGVDMPITRAVVAVVDHGARIDEVTTALLSRSVRPE